MKSKRQEQKENTRMRILEAAYRIYSQQGFLATTASIAKEAGVSHGTIFAHFPTLDDLLCDLVEDFGNTLGTETHCFAKGQNSIEELLKVHLAILAEHEDFYIRLISERSLLPSDAQVTFVNTQSVMAYHFSKAIEGEFRNQIIKNIPIHLLFNTWMGLIHYYLLNKEFFAPDTPLLERYQFELIKTYIELIKI